MTTACLQETYLLEEPCDQEVEKHHRAHHRGYNAPPTREKSRIRRFLLNSSPSRQLAVDDGSDVHTELPIKSSRSFIGYRASTVGDAAGLDAKPLEIGKSIFFNDVAFGFTSASIGLVHNRHESGSRQAPFQTRGNRCRTGVTVCDCRTVS
ncbi:hypothetical protein Pst134EB_028580 [Puccinia striiformis f. sp. tritici]|nr:hypothetical protein Pst134EB_028580 [Puccinia striiformis f. sp. tritici]